METTVNPATLDSRLASHGSTSYQRRQPPDTYRVQGHVPARHSPKRSTKEILAMPKGTRPRPRQPCFTCQRLGRSDMWHWRDECPNQSGPQQSKPRPQNRQWSPRPTQGPPKNKQALHQQRNKPRPNYRRIEDDTSAVARANKALDSLPREVLRGVLVKQAKELGL